MGSRMKIDVITKIPEEKKVTVKFDSLSLQNAIERFRKYADIVYIVVPKNPPSTVAMNKSNWTSLTMRLTVNSSRKLLFVASVIATPDPKDSEKKITKIMVDRKSVV